MLFLPFLIVFARYCWPVIVIIDCDNNETSVVLSDEKNEKPVFDWYILYRIVMRKLPTRERFIKTVG